MNKMLTILFAAILFAGCGASQADLTRLRTELRAEVQHTANSRALAVHECASTRAFAVRAAQHCEPFTAAGLENHGSCAAANLYRSYCIVMVPRRGGRVLTNPRPGIDQALGQLMEQLEANIANQSEGDSSTEVSEDQTIHRESVTRTFESQ